MTKTTVLPNIENLSDWINNQSPWAKDALRRLIGGCSEEDKIVIIANLKHSNGINLDQKPDIQVFSGNDFQTESSSTTSKTLLCSIGPSKYVNRLADDQILSFALNGLTLIYGDNGSGKSGYCKITKKLCRTLVKDHLFGNVFEEEASPKAEVKIKYQIEGENPVEELWIDETQPPEPISRLAVFDAKCARLYVDQENKIEYLPAEIDLLQKYSKLLEDIKKPLQLEMDNLQKQTFIPLPSGFKAHTETSKLINKLSIKSGSELPQEEEFRSFATWNIEDDQKILDIEKQLADNPTIKLKTLKTLNAFFINFSEKIEKIQNELSEQKIQELEKAFHVAELTSQAAKISASISFKEEKLSSTGSNPWKLMYKYATEYAQSIDANKIPSEIDDLCLLCQQPLDKDASERLKRFEIFVENKASKDAQIAAQALKNKIDTLNKIDLPKKEEYEAILEQYSSMYDETKIITKIIDKFLSECSELLEDLASCIKQNKFSQPKIPLSQITTELTAITTKLTSDINILIEDCTNNERYSKLQEELDALRDRKKLVDDLDIFIKRLSDLMLLVNLNKCIEDLNTGSVSRQITSLRKSLLTAELEANILEEIKAFDLSHIPFAINSKTNRGDTLVAVNLKSANSKVSNKDILSEGEQRALALSCFLAEIKRETISHGIIIDDPVSSLDHLRIRKVAERLTIEAKKRQVIIFTHNILFYNEVRNLAIKYSVALHEHYIHKSEEKGFGVINDPSKHWHITKVDQRIELLKSQAKTLTTKVYSNDESRRHDIKDFYTDLRETWERLIEEVLLNNVIERFDSGVQTKRLNGVLVNDEDCKTINSAMSKVSEYSGHDKAAGNSHPLPNNDEINLDLKEIEEFKIAIRKRSRKLEEERKNQQTRPLKAQIA